MLRYGRVRFVCGLIAATLAVGLSLASDAPAQGKKLKIGVIYDYTGPFAGGGSELHALGAKIMIDYFIKRGGVEGYQIEAIYADAQSKPDIAINEAVRLIEQEKVDMLLGFYSSAECVPAAARVEQLKKFMWITTCISSAVLENRNLKYVFRAQPSGRQFGLMSMDFLAQNAKAKLGKESKDLRVAIIHEDGAYGVDVSKGNEEGAKKAGFTVVLKEGYAATAPDLSALVTKLKRGRPDVIFHTGYNPDITLFLRQAREQGLRFSALIGHGAGYGVYDKLKEALGRDVNHFFNVDPISIWLANEKSLRAPLPAMIKMVGEEYEKARPGTLVKSAHVGMAASNTYLFALRKAALEVDLPEGGTMLGFGVKFEGEGAPMSGQNDRAFPVILQYVDDKPYLVWPKSQQQREPILPLPGSSPYAAQ
ncbi:MAG: ABC transporter ATP-binding protein [Candidatus Rokuibacteriota bacterium]|nr:MAG: ABC transporter ATP-binding protein [Candidatus Rokubacteria bacterium]